MVIKILDNILGSHGAWWAISFAENRRDGIMVCTISAIGIEPLRDNCAREAEATYCGVAFCSVKDEYNRLKGMRLSLHRALRNSPLPREAYNLVWKEWVRRHVGSNARVCKKPDTRFDMGSEIERRRKELFGEEPATIDRAMGEIMVLEQSGKLRPVI